MDLSSRESFGESGVKELQIFAGDLPTTYSSGTANESLRAMALSHSAV